jgi:aminoglycoside phosphotransferase (APT) family kinase protein
VLTPPDGLSEHDLAEVLERCWQLRTATMTYLPVGFGSHHWEVTDQAGTRWFVTADELHRLQEHASEPLDLAFGRLRAALGAAADLSAAGLDFVVAPVPTSEGEPLARAGAEFSVALHPLVDGQSFSWGEFSSPAHKRAVLDLLIAVHTAPGAARQRALTEGFAIPHRDELELALAPGSDRLAERGPYARPVAELIAGHAAPITDLLSRYDGLAAQARAEPGRAVLTHGEPHPGNTMLTSGGWRLIDWDTALIAPPERDLWSLDPGDGSVLAAYAQATGVTPLAGLLELYRVRWDLADVAIDVSRFRRRHAGTIEDDECWKNLRSIVGQIGAGSDPATSGP